MFLTILLILALVTAFYYYLTWNFGYWKARGVASPKPIALFGNFYGSRTLKNHLSDEFESFYNKYKGRANFIGTYDTRTPRILVLQPELVKEIFIQKFKNFNINDFTQALNPKENVFLERNIFFSSNDIWRELKTEALPAFSSNRMKALFPIVNDICHKLTAYICDNMRQPIDSKEMALRFVRETTSNCVFGIQVNSFQKEETEMARMSKKLFNPEDVSLTTMYINALFPFTRKFLKLEVASPEVSQFFLKLIENAKHYRSTNNIVREDFLDFLITNQKKKGSPDMHLASSCVTFFSDGLDSTSSTIASTLYELARNPEVQRKLRQEIEDFSSKRGEITYDVISEMPYLDQVVNESLRIHPPFFKTTRECTEKTQFEYTKGKMVLIEKGICIDIPIRVIQHDPEYYPNPDDFIPERFDPENGGIKAFKDKGVFIAFGDGPRICLGMKFANMLVKASVVRVIKNFQITVNEKTEPGWTLDPKEIVNRKRGGMWLNFRPIKNFVV